MAPNGYHDEAGVVGTAVVMRNCGSGIGINGTEAAGLTDTADFFMTSLSGFLGRTFRTFFILPVTSFNERSLGSSALPSILISENENRYDKKCN